MIDESLGTCIANTIKRREEEERRRMEDKRQEKLRLIEEIEKFFKGLPEHIVFEFDTIPIFSPDIRGDDNITIEKHDVSTVKIKSILPIKDWDIQFVRKMHSKLPEFEAELRKRYGC